MDALEAGSKATTEPRKRKRSGLVKDGPADVAVPTKSQESQPSPASQAGPAVSTSGEASPTPIKPMFNVNSIILCIELTSY